MAADASARGHPRDLVVIGASAGGVEALMRLVADLPARLPATICIVLHISPHAPSLLGQILSRAGAMPCHSASDGEELRHGEILVARPDRHLEVEEGRVRVTAGPVEKGHRPSVDALFRSAARAKGATVVGVVLSGAGGDGTTGLAAVRCCGGATIVQDPGEAQYPEMPKAALAHVAVDAVVPSGNVAETIVAMVKGQDPPAAARSDDPGHAPAAGLGGL